MSHAHTTLLIALSLVLTTAAAAQQHAAEAPSLPVTILPGEIPSERVAEGVPDLGFDPDWEWQALVCRKKCELEPVKLLLSPVKVQPYDGEPLPGHRYAIDRELDAHPLALLRGLPSSYPTRPKTWLHAGLESYASSTPGTMEADIPLDDGQLARLVPRYAGIIDGTPMFKVYLETKTHRQLLADLPVDAIAGPASLPRRQQMLRWAGDLDGDDKLDLIMTFSSRYGEDAAATLFLSSLAKSGDLVGMAGAFSYWPVGNPGC
jgi:hypothetical protein